MKCQKKGITCSGQGIRCRFSNHMSSNAPRSAAASTEQSSTKKLRWVDAGSRVRKGRQRRFTQGELKGNGYETLPGDSDDHLPSPLSDHGQLTLWSPPNEALLPQERMLFSHCTISPITITVSHFPDKPSLQSSRPHHGSSRLHKQRLPRHHPPTRLSRPSPRPCSISRISIPPRTASPTHESSSRGWTSRYSGKATEGLDAA